MACILGFLEVIGPEWILLDQCLARLAGFEPATPGFVDQCSIQLSYSRSYPVAIGILVRGEHRSFAYFKRSRLLYCSEEAQA